MSKYPDSKMTPETPPPQDGGSPLAKELGSTTKHQLLSQFQFPSRFNLYSTSTFSGRSYTLGEHRSQPLYAVSMHSGFSGKPSTILYSEASDKSALLGTADGSAFSSATTIELFLPGEAGSCTYHAKSGGGFPHPTYRFDVEVGGVGGDGGNGSRETFEWRHSKGDEVRALGGQHQGWKLVWLGNNGDGGSGSSVGGPKSSDGNEVVAVWAHGHMSRSKFFCFQFVGGGLGGGMGDRWTLVTILTALRMWDRERRARAAAGAAGGAGGGGS